MPVGRCEMIYCGLIRGNLPDQTVLWQARAVATSFAFKGPPRIRSKGPRFISSPGGWHDPNFTTAMIQAMVATTSQQPRRTPQVSQLPR